MTPREFEEAVGASAAAIIDYHERKGFTFSPDTSGIEEDNYFDYHYHILEWLEDEEIQSKFPGLATWLFKHAGEDLERDEQIGMKFVVLAKFAKNLVGEKKLLAKFVKGLDKEELTRLHEYDYFPIEVKSALLDIVNGAKRGPAPAFNFVLFAGLRVKRLESKVVTGNSLEAVIKEFSSWFVREYCDGDEKAFDIYTNGNMIDLLVVNNSYEKPQRFEFSCRTASDNDCQLISELFSKWCSDVEGVEAVVELRAFKK